MTNTADTRTAEAVSRYVHFWNSTPDEQRRNGGETFMAGAAYIAPAGVLTGVEALAAFTEQFVDNAGAYEFGPRTEPDMHNDHARLRWELRVGGTSFAEGTDMLTVGDDGRIVAVVTFIDRAPGTQPHHDEQDS